MAIVAKVGSRGVITIPRAIRRRRHIEEGDSVAFVCQDDGIVLKPFSKMLLDLRGSIPVRGPQDFSATRRQTIKARTTGVHPPGGAS